MIEPMIPIDHGSGSASAIPIRTTRKSTTPIWKVVLAILAISCATFVAPYFIPVKPSVSLSYAAGFNNHAAFLFFTLGSLLFAFLVKWDFNPSGKDSDLPKSALYKALGVALILCLLRRTFSAYSTVGDEAKYFLDRGYLLSKGLIPYRQFEFAYGPLLLYPGLWISRLLHVSQIAGYYIYWIAAWQAGVWMLWEIVRSIDIPTAHRTQIFALTYIFVIFAFYCEGVNYAPVRSLCAAFVIVIVYRIWRKYSSTLLTCIAATLGVALAIGCSPEQGISATAGFAVYFLYLALLKNSGFSLKAYAALLVAWTSIFVTANRLALFTTMRSFSTGGFNFPLLPSPSVFLILGCYLCAACVFVKQLRQRNAGSVALPLACAGFAMLPAAMGRCDLGHLMSAWPALLIGIFGMYINQPMRRLWIPLLWIVFGLYPGYGTAVAMVICAREAAEPVFLGTGNHPTSLQRFVRAQIDRSPGSHSHLVKISEKLTVRERLSQPPAPCDRIYLVPATGLRPISSPSPCLDSGYFSGTVNVLIPSQIQSKIDELAAHPHTLLLLPNGSPESSFNDHLDHMSMLGGLEQSSFIPKQRTESLDFTPISTYVTQHYTPLKEVPGTGFTIWQPNGTLVLPTHDSSTTPIR